MLRHCVRRKILGAGLQLCPHTYTLHGQRGPLRSFKLVVIELGLIAFHGCRNCSIMYHAAKLNYVLVDWPGIAVDPLGL